MKLKDLRCCKDGFYHQSKIQDLVWNIQCYPKYCPFCGVKLRYEELRCDDEE